MQRKENRDITSQRETALEQAGRLGKTLTQIEGVDSVGTQKHLEGLPGQSQSKALEQEKEQAEAIPAGKETVLLAEDDATIRRMIQLTMESEGYTILAATDGQEAIEISSSYEGDIHLLLTDVIMPKMNGQELANTMLQSRPEMEVIFMSGYTDDAISHHGVLEPGVHFIQKPITPSILAKKLREVLKK